MRASGIQFPPRLRLSRIPTPIEMLQWPPPAFEDSGVEIYIKRDDLTGCALTGNKVRKLDFLLADALAQGCDTILTCGAVGSNHCRATALGAASLGMRTHLLLRGEPPRVPDGNLFLSLLCGATVEYISQDAYAQRDRLLAEAADRLSSSGRHPYVIPEGGSNPLGCFGYINCVREIAFQSERMGYQFTHIVCASSSGGTQAGLVLGAQAYLPSVEVIGINVASRGDVLHQRLRQLIELWSREFQPEFDTDSAPITLLDNYVGAGYGVNQPQDFEIIRVMARSHGLLLDPVYTAKAFRGLAEEVRQGRFVRGSVILFIHTGGMHGLFPSREDLMLPAAAEAAEAR